MKVKSCDLLLILAALVVVYLVYRHYRKSKEGMQFQGTIGVPVVPNQPVIWHKSCLL